MGCNRRTYSTNNNTTILNVIFVLTTIDAIGTIAKGLYHNVVHILKDFGKPTFVNQAFADVPGNQEVTEIFSLLIKLNANSSKDITIVTPEHHLQSLIEAACLIRKEIGCSLIIRPAWQMIDSFNYGYYQDFVNHGVRIDIIKSTLNQI